MKKPISYTLVFCCLALFIKALPADSLVRFSDLGFRSDAEKNAFLNCTRSGHGDVIDLLLAPYEKPEGYSSKSAHEQISDCVTKLQTETQEQSNAKRVKYIYKYIHTRFLKVYKLQNSFSDIFEKGEYNCVSASALYAIIFYRMGIPFQIIEAPGHVYLIAFPQSDRIFIETTSPEHGYLKVSEGDMARYTKHLYDSKLITKSEYESKSSRELFDTYYYASSGIALEKMPGIQYSNYSLYYTDEKNYEKAAREIKKAYFIDASERNSYLLKSMLLYQVSNNDFSDLKQMDNLIILCRFNNLKDKELSNEAIRQEFGRVTNDQLIKNSDYVQFDSSFAKMSRAIRDTALKNEIAFDYHYELARLGYINLKNRDYELSHLAAAYAINPKHANLQNIILAYFSKLMERSNDPVSILKTMDAFGNAFPFLNDNAQYAVVKANCFLELAYQSIVLNNVSKGEDYLKSFETLCSGPQKLELNENYVEKAYSQAASYYYKKGNTAKTRQLLSTGIKYAPESFGLRMRLEQAR